MFKIYTLDIWYVNHIYHDRNTNLLSLFAHAWRKLVHRHAARRNPMNIFNPLTPWRTLVSPYHWNFNSILRRDHQKNFLWASRLWVGRKRAYLRYVPKNDEKKNLAHKGLKKMKISKLHWPFNAQDDTGVPLSLKFQFYIKKGWSKKFPMSVAPMSR